MHCQQHVIDRYFYLFARSLVDVGDGLISRWQIASPVVRHEYKYEKCFSCLVFEEIVSKYNKIYEREKDTLYRHKHSYHHYIWYWLKVKSQVKADACYIYWEIGHGMMNL